MKVRGEKENVEKLPYDPINDFVGRCDYTDELTNVHTNYCATISWLLSLCIIRHLLPAVPLKKYALICDMFYEAIFVFIHTIQLSEKRYFRNNIFSMVSMCVCGIKA